MRQGIKYAKQMWVHPAFLKKMKKDAVDKDMSIIDYSKFLSNETNNHNNGFGISTVENNNFIEKPKRKTYLGLRL